MLIEGDKQMKYATVGVGILCITLLECIAILNGIDGTVLALAFGAICTIVGYIGGQKTTKL